MRYNILIPCCCHFSAVTEKPSGNPKDTLLCF